MIPNLNTKDARKKQAAPRFTLRDFGHVLAMVKPYTRLLAAGLCATVIFASLHTAGIAAVFPVFKILLEEEGLEGWIDRQVTGDRLGVDLLPPSDEHSITIAKVHKRAEQVGMGSLEAGDRLADAQGRPVATLLSEVADAAPRAEIRLTVYDQSNQARTVTVRVEHPGRRYRMLLWAAQYIPPGTDQPDGKLALLVRILIGLVIVVVLANVFRYVGELLIATAVLRSMLDLRARLYDRALLLPMAYFSGRPTADLVTRFVQDIQEVQRGLLTFFGKFIREPLKAALILGLALALDWRITLTMVVVVPVTVAIFWSVGRKVKKANRRLLQGYSFMIDALTASLQNLRVVKVYTAETRERELLRKVDRHMFRQQLKLARLQAFVSPMIETLAVIAGSVVTVWLAGRVLNENLEISTFTSLGVALAMLFDPLRKLTDVYVRVTRSTAGAERIFQVINEPGESDNESATRDVSPLTASIEFSKVTYAYPGADAPALQDINLSIAKGETIALVGPNGCGKTTLVSMLPRLLVPDTGEIRYDGVELSTLKLHGLRGQISVVTQDAVVFAGTPADNIAYGSASVDRARVEQAAQRAFADEFIRNIPGAYDADLGERGTTLSGGQRQRLAIARAIYRDAPILIFDEATSQIDSESERKIQNALQDFATDRTTIIIAHRLSTIQFADRIVVMDAGRIIDNGTHKELYDRCKLYRTLCDTQFMRESEST